MNKEFTVQVFSPSKRLIDAQVTEVVLPSHDGEVGVLASHEDYVGLLGTGVLKVVRGGDDYWYMVSSGVWEVEDGKLVILAETAEEAKELDGASSTSRLKELEAQMVGKSAFSDEYTKTKREYDRLKARLEAFRRTQLN